MKPILFKHSEAEYGSFFILNDKGPHFYDILHFHPFYQLTYIAEGMGTVFIADCIDRFNPGDVFFIAPDIPHVFRCDSEYYQNDQLQVNGISIYFKPDSFGNGFFDLPDNTDLKHILRDAASGLKFSGFASVKTISQQFFAMLSLKGVPRLATFMLLLNDIAHIPDKEKKKLSSAGFTGSVMNDSNDRMGPVFDYIMNNFLNKVTLKEVADIACMTTNAFCRFFKKRTGKGLMEFIIAVRIGYACKLILQEKYSVSEIAHQSGFNNISNFNRQFRKMVDMTPLEYIKAFKHNQNPAA